MKMSVAIFSTILLASGPRRRSRRRRRHDQDRRDQLLLGVAFVHRPLSQGLATGAGRDQRRRRRRRQEARGDLEGRRRQARRRGDAANELVASDGVVMLAGTLLLQHRPRRFRLRQAEEDPVPRRRAAHRRDHLVERQSVHVPAAAGHLRTSRHAGRRGRQTAGEDMGDDRPQLRIRPVRRQSVQGFAVCEAARHPVGRRAMAAAGQDRRRRGRRGDRQDRARRDLQRFTFGPDLVKLVREARRGASSRIARSSASCPASRNISTR